MLKKNTEQRNRRFIQRREERQGKVPRAKRVAMRCLAVLGTILLLVPTAFFGAVTVVCKGPSPTARDLFVTTVMETSAAKFLARMYFSDEEIEAIQQKNMVVEATEVTHARTGFTPAEEGLPKEGIELVDVNGGPTFKGKMLIVHDPSRVRLAVAPAFGKELDGVRVEDFVKNAGAVAGVNGGGFWDENGVGRGGMPLGLVIKDSRIINGSAASSDTLVGFDENDRLVVGKMTGQQALERKMRDAVAFGPVFIVNGKSVEVVGTGGGLNPRTAIGQREDGAVLLLVIDGRQPNSIGASYKDCIDVMTKFGAVNAANLDGGSSSLLYYNGEVVSVSASLYGSRRLPTAFIVQ